MAFSKMTSASIVFAHVLIVLVTCNVCFAEDYKVGDEAGWAPNVNYTAWSFPKHFQVGDVVWFVYDNKTSNVVQVPDRKRFHNCDASRALSKWTSGNDSIKITRSGHHLFISNLNNKCHPQQLVDINSRPHSAPEPFPSPVPVPAPAESPASVLTYCYSSFGLVALGLLMLWA